VRDAGRAADPARRGGGDRLLIVGVSVRALAASACRSRLARARFPGGFLALDYFGDADLLALRSRGVETRALTRDLGLQRSLPSLGRAAQGFGWDACLYGGGLENRPGLLRLLARRGPIVGNGPEVVRAVRDPARLFPFLRRAGLPHAPSDAAAAAAPRGPRHRHLWKRIRSGGGLGVRPARPGERRPRGHYLQRFLPGPCGSAAALGDGRAAVVFGVTEQIVGWTELGGTGYRYGGSLTGPAAGGTPAGWPDELPAIASALVERFGLRGLFGFDFILRRGRPCVVEVNPRVTASMELLEERGGFNLIDLHLEALAGSLPAIHAAPAPAATLPWLGRGVLYARAPSIAPDPEELRQLGCRDRPVRGETFRAGQPICTVVASGTTRRACRAALERTARTVYRRVRPAQRRAGARLPALIRTW
jgi:uncharacterized protein